MNWPLSSDYQDAIQNPSICFQDPELKAGSVALTPLGLPRVASGQFAVVYEINDGTNRWAVRCFSRPVSDQQHRYSLLSEHMERLELPALVNFQYLPEGILVDGQWYPIVKMEWVDGDHLHTFVEQNLDAPGNLARLAAQWRGTVNSLRGSNLAHGDLQHGNVLITPERYTRLVDYDAMYLPSLSGEESPELGHENYQHPERTSKDYSEALDNFAALVTYTSLQALVAEPDLWQEFHTGENLILSASDYRAPEESAVLQRLKQSAEPCVCQLAAVVESSCLDSPANVPDFEPLVAALPPLSRPASRPSKESSVETPGRKTDVAPSTPGRRSDVPSPKPTASRTAEETESTFISSSITPPESKPWSWIAMIAGLALVALVAVVLLITEPWEQGQTEQAAPTDQTQVDVSDDQQPAVEPVETYGHLRVQQVRPWAYVYIDDQQVATTPIAEPIKVETGRHSIKLENPHTGGAWQEYHDFQEGEIYTLPTIELRTDAYVKVQEVKPWAHVYIDDQKVDTTPISEPIKVEPGPHSIKLENPRTGKTWQQQHDFQKGETYVLPEVDLR